MSVAQRMSSTLTFPFDRPDLGAPAEYASLRREGSLQPVRLWDGKVAWLATRYDDVRALLADNRFSADPRREGYPSVTPARAREKREHHPFFVMLDPPEHTRYRRMLTKEFTVSRIEGLRPMVERVVYELLDQLEAGGTSAEMVRQFCLPLPTSVIAAMLGVPYADHAFFQDRTVKLLGIDGEPGMASRAGDDLRNYMVGLLKEKARDPHAHDDILGRLIVDQIEPEAISYDEAAMLVVLLMLAGHETTANMIGLGLLSLLMNRPAFEAVSRDEAGDTIKRAVEEMLRIHSIVHYTGTRVALEDVQFGDTLIQAGEGILPQILAANHDPSRFPQPEEFDLARVSTAPHVAFGFGIHQCLGQPLARMELNCVFDLLPKRLPAMRLQGSPDDLPFKRNLLVHGLKTLPVSW